MTAKAERIWMDNVASLGCLVCKRLGFEDSPAELHHIRTGQGRGQRAGYRKVIPLCHPHHRTGGPGVAFHATGREEWEGNYGTELELLEQVMTELCVT